MLIVKNIFYSKIVFIYFFIKNHN